MMNIERPIKVITGYDSYFFNDVVRRYPITNTKEWSLDGTETEYVSYDNNGNVPRRDPWGRKFRDWICGDDPRIHGWDIHSFDPSKLRYTRWTSVDGVPIKLVVFSYV